MTDWISALGDLPQQAVADAIAEWVRGETRRPTPADIRKRAAGRVAPKAPPVPDDDEWPFGPSVVSAAELQRRREMQARMAEAYPILRKMED